MAHEIDMTTGKAGIAYAGETPWHGLGTKFDGLMTSQEALEAAGLNFKVEKYPVTFFDGTEHHPVPDRFATVRTDTKLGLGTVGPKYQPLQNVEAFDFLDSLVADGKMRYEVAGSLYDGRRVWMLAKLPTQTVVSHDDVTDHYILLSNGHDGMRGCSVAFTTVRVVCANTLRLADTKLKHEFRIRHSGSITAKLEEAREVLGLAENAFKDFGAKAKMLSFKEVKNQAKVDEFIHSVLGVKGPDDLTGPQKKAKDRIKELSETGLGTDLSGVRGTYWGLFNSVTEFVDHEKANGRKSRFDEEEARVESITFGGGDVMKQRAWNLALATV